MAVKAQTIDVEADSLEEAKRLVRERVPDGLQLLSEEILSDGEPRTVTTVAATVDAAVEEARGKVPGECSVLTTEVLASPGEEQVRAEGASEEEARQAMTEKLKTGVQLRSVRLIAGGKKGFLGINKKPSQYEGDVLQQAVVELTHTTKARISAQVGESPKARLAAEADAWQTVPSGGVCDLCGAQTGATALRIPNAQFKSVVELGYNPALTGRASAAIAVSGAGPTEWYMQWKTMVWADPTDWGLCGVCVQDVRRFLAT